MKSKMIVFSLCAAFLGGETAFSLNCPAIPKNWDGKTLEVSGKLTWSVGKLKLKKEVEPKDVIWQAQQVWILPQNTKQHEKDGYFQCIYQGFKGEIKKENRVGKLIVASPQTPELKTLAEKYEFKKPSTDDSAKVINNYNDGKKAGATCIPKQDTPESLNQFPKACEMVERKK